MQFIDTPFLRRRAAISMSLAALTVAGLTFAPAACTESSGTTTGKRLTVALRVRAAEGGSPIVNKKGWTVTLTKAAISTGPFYLYEGAPIFSLAEPPVSAPFRLRDFLPRSSVAHAHPGHYVAGEARGQMLTSNSVDLMTGEVDYPRIEAVSGITRSGTFSFASPATGPAAEELGNHVIVVEGTAAKATLARSFRAEINPADVLHDGQLIVEGCPFKEVDMQTNGTVTLSVSLGQWFEQASTSRRRPQRPSSRRQPMPTSNSCSRAATASTWTP